MKKEKPIKVVPSKGRRHKTETRIFARNIRELFCRQPGCKFKGKHAAQGVCHTTDTFAGGADWKHMDAAFELGKKATDEVRRILRGNSAKHKIDYLLAMHESYWVNNVFHLDEMVRLRRENALLKRKLNK